MSQCSTVAARRLESPVEIMLYLSVPLLQPAGRTLLERSFNVSVFHCCSLKAGVSCRDHVISRCSTVTAWRPESPVEADPL